jgi:hypothetical protein
MNLKFCLKFWCWQLNYFFAVDARPDFRGLLDGALAGRPEPLPFFLLSPSLPFDFPAACSLTLFRSAWISSRRCLDLAANWSILLRSSSRIMSPLMSLTRLADMPAFLNCNFRAVGNGGRSGEGALWVVAGGSKAAPKKVASDRQSSPASQDNHRVSRNHRWSAILSSKVHKLNEGATAEPRMFTLFENALVMAIVTPKGM